MLQNQFIYACNPHDFRERWFIVTATTVGYGGKETKTIDQLIQDVM